MQVGEFLIKLSGAREDLLEWVPEERPRYMRVGAALLNSSFLASTSIISAVLAVGISIWIALPLGALWGVIVLCLDQFLVAGLDSSRSRTRVLAVVSRIVVSVFIGFIIATPLQLLVFQSAIDNQLRADGVNRDGGMLERVQALQQLSESSRAVFLAVWLLTLLIILVTSLPQLIAILSLFGPVTQYQRLTAAEQQSIEERQLAKKQLLEDERSLALEAIRSARERSDTERDKWVQGLLDTIDVLGPPPADQPASSSDERSAR